MRYQINDIFSDWLTTGGIFTLLSAAAGGDGLPWTMNSGLLDLDYHGNYSGDKLISPLVKKMLKADGEAVSTVHKSQLALIIYNRFRDNWQKRWDALQTIYNPLENYSMVEQESGEGSNTGTVGHATSESETTERDNTVRTDTEALNNIYGYDSSSPSPSDSQSGNSDTSGSETGSRSRSGSDTRTDNLANTYEKSLTRSGNIGVTTSQQMLQSELDIRTYDFYKSVYDDIDKVLTIQVY